jgi:hypothetical protein
MESFDKNHASFEVQIAYLSQLQAPLHKTVKRAQRLLSLEDRQLRGFLLA